MKKIVAPHSVIIEKTALEFAATFYEVGRGQGLKSKYKDARSYAKANLEKFIPKAVDTLIDMLGKPHVPADQKQIIFDALKERVDDPELKEMLPDIDISKLIPTKEKPPVIINTTKPKLDIENVTLPMKGL